MEGGRVRELNELEAGSVCKNIERRRRDCTNLLELNVSMRIESAQELMFNISHVIHYQDL